MGNSSYPKAALKSAISTGDLDQLRTVLKEFENSSGRSHHNESAIPTSCTDCTSANATVNPRTRRTWLLSQSLNKKGDSALALCVRNGQLHLLDYLLDSGSPINAANKDGETVLDILLNKVVPGEGDILHNHFCPYSHTTENKFKLPEEARTLIKAGAKGSSLHKLILYVMKDEPKLEELSELILDLESENNFRLSGLILQVAVWFDRIQMVVSLLERGIDAEVFWKAPFIPTIVPNTNYRRVVSSWENMSTDTEGEYVVSCPDKVISVDTSASLQSLKLSFVQDWRADWYDGENPDAQYRAGLLLTVDGAVIVIKSANRQSILSHVVDDVLQYLPVTCGGPDLRKSPVIPLLILAGYDFSKEEKLQLHYKYSTESLELNILSRPLMTLKQLSRIAVRNNLSLNAFVCVPKLTCLPLELRNYLFFSDIVV